MREAACCSVFRQYFLSATAMLSEHGNRKWSFDAAHTWAASRKESRIARTVVLKLKTSEFKILTRNHTAGSPLLLARS